MSYFQINAVSMKEQAAIQNLLRRKLTELQRKNPKYSVRAFSLKVGLQPSATNEILKGERRVSRKLAERIVKRLFLDPTERNDILRCFPERTLRRKNRSAPLEMSSDSIKLSADQFYAISDWVHYAILSLMKTQDFRPETSWIAHRLGITPNKAALAIERLERLGMIEKTPSGSLRRLHARINTSDDVLDLSIQKSHHDDMAIASQALTEIPVQLRDFTSMTIPTSPALLPKAKELIRKAQDEIYDLLASQAPSEVYRLSVYLFPLTKISKNEGDLV